MKMTLQEALDSLPEKPDDVAALLNEKECRGIPKDSDYCPLARWLTKQVGEPVAVGIASAWLRSDSDRSKLSLPHGAYWVRKLFDEAKHYHFLRS